MVSEPWFSQKSGIQGMAIRCENLDDQLQKMVDEYRQLRKMFEEFLAKNTSEVAVTKAAEIMSSDKEFHQPLSLQPTEEVSQL